MNRSEQIGDLAAALAKAQKALKPATKDATNPFYRSNYADLPSVVAACRDALADNALSYSQMTDYSPDGIWLETVLMHSSGQWISGRYPVNPVKSDPQGVGSALTYSRRYALMALVGIVADDDSDDDGNAASGHDSAPVKRIAREPAPPPPPVSDALKKSAAITWARTALDNLKNYTDRARFDEWVNLNADKVSKIQDYDAGLHTKLTEAIRERHLRLQPVNAG